MRFARRQTLGLIEQEAARFTYIDPTGLGTMGLWYDWSQETPTNSLATVTDRSAAGNNGTCYNTVGVFGDRDLAYGYYQTSKTDTASSYIQYASVNVRSVIRALIPMTNGQFFLSDSSNYNFHSQLQACCHADYAAAAVINGAWRVNGRDIANPTVIGSVPEYASPVPLVISCVTTGAVSQNRLGWERIYNMLPHILMEDLLYTDALSAANVLKIEHYLALKWQVENYVF